MCNMKPIYKIPCFHLFILLKFFTGKQLMCSDVNYSFPT